MYSSPCRPPTLATLSKLREFLDWDRTALTRLPPGSHDAFIRLASLAPHLRVRQAREFFTQLIDDFNALGSVANRPMVLQRAMVLGEVNWSLVHPYLASVACLADEPGLLDQWLLIARRLAQADIDVAVAYLEQTPTARGHMSADALLDWGRPALDALNKHQVPIWKAARAYLLESAKQNHAAHWGRWPGFLQQAATIAAKSANASEAFVLQGSRVCQTLTENETRQWVEEGLEQCLTEDELIQFFSGTSHKAITKRDDLASGLSLKQCSNTLALICQAFLGSPVSIRANNSLMGVLGFSGGPASDGRTIFLPASAKDFTFFKLMALHQAALLKGNAWQNHHAEHSTAYFHLRADRLLLGRLPGLRRDMAKLDQRASSDDYPWPDSDAGDQTMGWWGDLLPELAGQTQDVINDLSRKAADEGDLPPELVEALLTSMMAEGQRDPDSLWAKLCEMVDLMELDSPDPEELQENFKTFFYREWDLELADYKLDRALVRQRLPKSDPLPFVDEVRERLHGLIGLIRKQFTRLKPERFRKFRAQTSGDNLDIDALIQAVVEMRSGSFLSDAVYIRRDKRVRDVSVLFLLDLSASSEEMVQGRRVIDIEKEAMVLMAEALEAVGDPFAIYGFCSEGRFRVDMFAVKDFHGPYDQAAQNRLGSLEPHGLTRLGAVIRHATHKLAAQPSLIKLMIILTDGRPYDLGYGNLEYAIEDSRKAIGEARQQRVHPFVITSDQRGAEYLKQMAPHTQNVVLPKVEMLPTVLPAMYKRLTL